ncbi:ANTAR domain-containing response regulator [Paludifilum halophilum]|uniref:ANTAR domain-containing response regulator n=1 Tax=Paludifilum halophilum TaxID=1642702 RepID=UPI00146DFC33|nr:ANTAR domain-containing protein [Paludifilum halophilum]
MYTLHWIAEPSQIKGLETLSPESVTADRRKYIPFRVWHMLKDAGYILRPLSTRDQMEEIHPSADAVIWAVPATRVSSFTSKPFWKSLPRLWVCDESNVSDHHPLLEEEIDGILHPGMKPEQIRWTLLLGERSHHRRQQRQREIRRLQTQLEERKWIDQAKGILCEVKQLSEAEAYGILRRQAMNERRKIGDVAFSIVHVYRMLQKPNAGGNTNHV